MSDMLIAVMKLYDGYNAKSSNIQICNLYSIVSYMKSKKFYKFWVKSGNM